MAADVYADDGYYAVVPEWVLDADISAQAVRLYAVLRRYADHRSREAHPSRKTLATRMRVSNEKTVDRALEELDALGAVTTFGRWLMPDGTVVYDKADGNIGRSSNGYRIHRYGAKKGEGAPSEGTTPPPSRGTTLPPPEGEELQPENHSQENHTLPATRGDGYTAEFEDFWQHYPRKIEKADAFKAWRTALKRTDAATLIRAVRAYRFNPDPKYIKHAATWLNKRAWEDVPVAVEPATGTVRPMYDVSKIPANGELWSDAQVDMVLGPDTTPVDPPPGMDPDAAWRWTENETRKRKALRKRQAQELTGWRFEA